MKKLIILISIGILSIFSCKKETPEIKKTTCFTKVDTIKPNSSIINKWVLVGYIDSLEVCHPDSIPEIYIEFIDSIEFRGFDGCNGYNGKYEILKPGEIHVLGVIGTTLYCIEPINFWEQKLLLGIRDSESYEINGEKLSIKNENGYKLVFKQII